MSNILHLIRPNLMICRIYAENLQYVRTNASLAESRIIDEVLFRQIEAGEVTATLEMGYSCQLDEAPTDVIVETKTTNPTTQDEVVSTLDLESHTKVELLECIMSIDPSSKLTMKNTEVELITAIQALNQTKVKAFFSK